MNTSIKTLLAVLSLTFAGFAQAASTPIDFSNTCSGGGTKVVKGSFDSTSGALDVTITMTACIGGGGATHDGTATVKGTLKLDSATKKYSVDLAENIDTNIKFKDGGTVKRTCALTKVGSYDTATDMFTGKVTRSNCSLDGSFTDRQGILENLLRKSTSSEEL